MTALFSLNRAQAHLVRRTFGIITRNPRTFIRLFYDRLFELDPTLRPPLGADMELAHRTLMQTLALLSTATDRPERLAFYSQDFCTRMQRSGFSSEQYQVAGSAMLWAVERTLDDHCTPAVLEAWQALTDLVGTFAIETSDEALLH